MNQADAQFVWNWSTVGTTVVVTGRESGAWRWALLQFGGLTLLAYGVTVAVYQSGRLLGF
jgi:ferrous iron transport protein B